MGTKFFVSNKQRVFSEREAGGRSGGGAGLGTCPTYAVVVGTRSEQDLLP